MKNSEQYKLAFQCLISDKNSGFDSIFINKIASNEELLLKFIHLSSNHLIIPAVFKRLKEKGLTRYFSADLTEHLENLLQLNIERNRQILQQIDEICAHLHKAGIEPVFMKGTAHLLDGLYPDLADRMIGDIDFLVRDEDYLPTAEIVLKLGYKTDSPFYDDVMTLKHYPRLFRGDVPADVEIHRVPVEIPFSGKFTANIIFNNKKPVANKDNCFVSSDSHKIIHTFIHSQLSNQGFRFKQIGLRDLYDFYLLSKRVNVKEVIDTIEEKKKAEIFSDCVQHLIASPQHLKVLRNKKAKTFVACHEWFCNHPKQHYFYINSLKLYELIFKRYLGRIISALYQRSSFNYIYNRLKDPKWFRNHIDGLRQTF